MNQTTTTVLVLAAVGIAGYAIWKSHQVQAAAAPAVAALPEVTAARSDKSGKRKPSLVAKYGGQALKVAAKAAVGKWPSLSTLIPA